MPDGLRGARRAEGDRGGQGRGSQGGGGKKKDAEGENASRSVRFLFGTFQ
jgi:hypothetical protein